MICVLWVHADMFGEVVGVDKIMCINSINGNEKFNIAEIWNLQHSPGDFLLL